MLRAAHASSSGALAVFAASGLYMHVVTGRSQVLVGTEFIKVTTYFERHTAHHQEL
jgi:hypothetical protein